MTTPVPARPRRKRLRRWLLAIALGAVVVLAASVVAGWLYLRASLPEIDGLARVTGLAEPVDVVRDRHGVPHIYARTEPDAYFALGYAHAQDRLWQLELVRRAGAGRLSEVFGAETLADDRLLRTLGFRRSAAADLAAIDPATRGILEAYSRGVNAHLERGQTLPPEFKVFGVVPEPWTPIDSIAVLKVMAWELSPQLRRELLRVRLVSKLGAARAGLLMEGVPAAAPGDSAMHDLAPAAAALMARLPAVAIGIGSNSWAIGGARSETARPWLANDPHMSLSAPAVFYLAHLEAPPLCAIGATIPGLPGIIVGRTRGVAWGFTNTRSDTLDLYLERLDPRDASRYVTPDGERAFEIIRETIRVAGAADHVLDVRVSRHGPVVSDVLTPAHAVPPGHVLALRFAALAEPDRTIRFPLVAAHAGSVDDLLEAARDFHAPPQNIVAADTAGHIGFVAAGRVPLRAPDNELRGLVPMPGWLARYDWRGYIPFDELPAERDPASGRIVTANNDITRSGYPHWLTADWAEPSRARRIAQLLDARPTHSLATQSDIQLDVYSERAATLLPILLRLLPAGRAPAALRAGLERWRFDLSKASFEAALFEVWLAELGRAVYEDELAELLPDLWSDAEARLAGVLAASGTPLAQFCDDVRTSAVEDCSAAVGLAFDRAIARLRDRGAWGTLHTARFAHTPFGDVPLIGRWFDVRVASAGGNDTINLGESIPTDERAPFTGRWGPSYRAVYDLADPERSRYLLAPGQSGHVLSRFYRDTAEAWAEGQLIPMRTARAEIDRESVGTLLLRPR